jgi:DNA-binding GntR family transcriptional regulator
MSLDNINEILAIIGCLDGYAASLAVQNLSDKDFAAMEKYVELIDKCLEKEELNKYPKLQEDFHNVYISACGNNELIALIGSMRDRHFKKSNLEVYDKALFKALKEGNKDHRNVIRLLKKGKRKEVEIYLREVHWTTPTASAFYLFQPMFSSDFSE